MKKNIFKNGKFLKICGVILIACGVFGVFYIIDRGSARISDVMEIFFFFAFGIYSLNKK